MAGTSMERVLATTLITLLGLALSNAAPTPTPEPLEEEISDDIIISEIFMEEMTLPTDDKGKAEEYLSQFYYNTEIDNSTTRDFTLDSFNTPLEKMQEFFGLEVTGKLDSKTLEVMAEPRCGVPDVPSAYGHFQGRPKWRKSLITYRITEYTRDLSRSQVDATIAQAFKLYSDVIPLDFRQITSGTADIMILFRARYHGDFYPFDGPNGVLAHANSPGEGVGGDTHFDEDEPWTLSSRGINLLLVAAHEFGHALGLDHSRDRNALLFPTYRYVNTNGYKLPDDDKRGVQALYGVRQQRPDPKPAPRPDPKPEPRPEPRPEPQPDPFPNPPTGRCNRNLVFDAATAIRNELYFFKNGYFWKTSGYFQGVMTKKVSTTWNGLRGLKQVDAAYEYKDKDMALLFDGRRYWATRGITVLRGYPKYISKLGFPSYVKKIDAAVHVPSTKRTLFFAMNLFWSYNEQAGKMDRGYPKQIYKEFPGIGYYVDAAFENHGFLYFSNGARQTEYDYGNKRIVRTLLNYAWLECY